MLSSDSPSAFAPWIVRVLLLDCTAASSLSSWPPCAASWAFIAQLDGGSWSLPTAPSLAKSGNTCLGGKGRLNWEVLGLASDRPSLCLHCLLATFNAATQSSCIRVPRAHFCERCCVHWYIPKSSVNTFWISVREIWWGLVCLPVIRLGCHVQKHNRWNQQCPWAQCCLWPCCCFWKQAEWSW